MKPIWILPWVHGISSSSWKVVWSRPLWTSTFLSATGRDLQVVSQFLPLSVDHSEQVSPCWASCEVRRAKDLQQAVSTQTGCPCGPGPLEKQRRSNSRQREGLLQGPPAEMPMELGGQLNRLIKTRVRKLMKGEWEMKLMRWWEYLLGKLDFTLRLVYTRWSRRGSCAKSHLVFWSFPTWPTALQEFFSFEYFLVQLMSFSPTDV